MKIADVMTTNPRTATPDDRLHDVARVLWERDCGCVPIVDEHKKPVGMITDRDACMAVYTQGKRLDEIPARAVMSRNPAICRADEPVEAAALLLRSRQIHRLPVVDAAGKLVGIVSTNDLIRAVAKDGRGDAHEKLVQTLAAIGAPRSAPKAEKEKSVVVPAVAPTATPAPTPPVAVPAPVAAPAVPVAAKDVKDKKKNGKGKKK